jgi:hypothetical protein
VNTLETLIPAGSFTQPVQKQRLTLYGWMNYWHSLQKRRHVHWLYSAGTALSAVATRAWEISPATETVQRQAYFLPNQFERVTGMAYTDNPLRDMTGGIRIPQSASQAFLVHGAWLLDGSIHVKHRRFDLHARWRIPRPKRYLPRMIAEIEIEQAAVYGSHEGNEFFGLWLSDDCPAYLLASQFGIPVNSGQTLDWPHLTQYEQLLDMHPVRTNAAFLKEAVLFDDTANTADKRLRSRQVAQRLLAHVTVKDHPGVFIMRRTSGLGRVMRNEEQIAEHLRQRRGFQVVDVGRDDARTILTACAGARVIAGVEGSNLVHGVMVLAPGRSVLVIQPPYRFSSVIKRNTDADGQHYAFVVGQAVEGGFVAEAAEIDRTLDLLPENASGSLQVEPR